MKRFAVVISVLLLCCCCGKVDYVDWLYEAMPLPDSLMYPREFWEANAAKTLEVRKKMNWDIPEREFRHFVLPLRVNNESLDDFRTEYADTLCARVQGMDITRAALEINHWCHEQACYEPADARTSAPMATVRRGVGRCGEESVLAVAALRAAGIPARQVYTPRWAHTDDNHAWVEVYTDGRWHFMGACEPAPTLDNAWFNAPVSRALLLHTKVYGDYQGPEDVIQRTPCYTEINVIRGYVPARRTVVTVFDGGAPVIGALVQFKIYNYAEFYTVATCMTGPDGTAALDTGLGDMLVWAQRNGRFGFARASSERVTVRLDHNMGERFSADLDIVPPPENPIPSGATPEQEEANRLRLSEEDAIRNSHPHNNPDADAFLAAHGAEGQRLLDMLPAKDRGDATLDVLEDALAVASTDADVISPRVELEPLRPFRAEVLASGIAGRLRTPEDVRAWVRDSIRLVEGRNPQRLRTAPIAVWRARVADKPARDIFYVALCRAVGCPARIDPVTGKVQYYQKDMWVDVHFEEEEAAAADKGCILPQLDDDSPISSPEYYRNFTFSAITPEGTKLLEYPEGWSLKPGGKEELSVDAGYYVLTTGTRLQDGSVRARMEFFSVPGSNGTAAVPLTLRKPEGGLSVIGTFNAESPFLPIGAATPESLLEATGRGLFLVALLGGSGDEPTNHALHELSAAAQSLNAWGHPVVLLSPADVSALAGELSSDVVGSESGDSLRKELASAGSPGSALPIIALCDSFGRIFYISKGYNTSLAGDLQAILR
ncbi:MAG: transglutaminase domain-containing protein [Bacteroidales bacterium]|nr:transglutaminase domain-containing protein [Bacteroidales bacterium]